MQFAGRRYRLVDRRMRQARLALQALEGDQQQRPHCRRFKRPREQSRKEEIPPAKVPQRCESKVLYGGARCRRQGLTGGTIRQCLIEAAAADYRLHSACCVQHRQTKRIGGKPQCAHRRSDLARIALQARPKRALMI